MEEGREEQEESGETCCYRPQLIVPLVRSLLGVSFDTVNEWTATWKIWKQLIPKPYGFGKARVVMLSDLRCLGRHSSWFRFPSLRIRLLCNCGAEIALWGQIYNCSELHDV
jgi:hypothetical protein